MKTTYRIDRETGAISIDVQDAVGDECQTKNKRFYSRLRKELSLPESAFKEEPKPEMFETPNAEAEDEKIAN